MKLLFNYTRLHWTHRTYVGRSLITIKHNTLINSAHNRRRRPRRHSRSARTLAYVWHTHTQHLSCPERNCVLRLSLSLSVFEMSLYTPIHNSSLIFTLATPNVHAHTYTQAFKCVLGVPIAGRSARDTVTSLPLLLLLFVRRCVIRVFLRLAPFSVTRPRQEPSFVARFWNQNKNTIQTTVSVTNRPFACMHYSLAFNIVFTACSICAFHRLMRQ